MPTVFKDEGPLFAGIKISIISMMFTPTHCSWDIHKEDAELRSIRYVVRLTDFVLSRVTAVCTVSIIRYVHVDLRLSSMGSHPHRKRSRVAGLHEDSPRPRKFTNQTLTRANAGDDAPTGHSFHDIFAIPRYQVAVVDYVFLFRLELRMLSEGSTYWDEVFHELTSFLTIAPKLDIHIIPVPLIRYTKKPSPEKKALLIPWFFISFTTPCVAAIKASLPTFHSSFPVNRSVVRSPRKAGAIRISPGPVYVEAAISLPVMSFFMENLTAPLSVTEGDMDIMTPVRVCQCVH